MSSVFKPDNFDIKAKRPKPNNNKKDPDEKPPSEPIVKNIPVVTAVVITNRHRQTRIKSSLTCLSSTGHLKRFQAGQLRDRGCQNAFTNPEWHPQTACHPDRSQAAAREITTHGHKGSGQHLWPKSMEEKLSKVQR